MDSTRRDETNFMSDSNKSRGSVAGGTDSCTTAHISSGNGSVSNTSILYEYDKSVEIKEEIIQERHQGEEHNLLSEKSQLVEKSISSENKSALKTAILYEYDETLEIKEEIIQDPATFQKFNKKYESTLNTVDTRKADSLATSKLWTRKKMKIQKSKSKPLKKYSCQQCARSYKQRSSLYNHQKFACGVTTQFICEFCDKRFTQKGNMNRHVRRMHQKTNLNQNKAKIQESKQEPEAQHNISRHPKTNPSTSQACYKCDKCSQIYRSLNGLDYHNLVKHTAVKPQFICDVCDYKTYMKSSLSKHISLHHSKNSKTSQVSYGCDKCSINYSSLRSLRQHERLKHSAIKPEFICDLCGFKTAMKHHLLSHMTFRHFKNLKISQASYKCDKCSQIYRSLTGLHYHNLVEHTSVKPEFICDVCGYKVINKSSMKRHISSLHLK